MTKIPEVTWPTHDFAPDAYGHNCAECPDDSDWKCDKVAHELGEHARGLNLIDAIGPAKWGYEQGAEEEPETWASGAK